MAPTSSAANTTPRALHGIHGLPSAALRLFNVYGPGQDPRSPYAGVIARFLGNLRQGRAHSIQGDGGQTRDFVEMGDVVRAFLMVQDRLAQQPQALLCNVCTGRSISRLDLAATLDRLRGGAPMPIHHAPARAGDIRLSLGSTARMEACLGLRAATPIGDGLARLL